MTRKSEVTANKIYKFVESFILENLYAPSLLEIAEEFNMKSMSNVRRYLDFLELFGKIKVGKGARAIRLVGYKMVKDDEVV